MSLPEHIGEYAIEAVVGTGRSTVVYRAYDANSKRRVALKTIARSLIEQDIKGNQLVRGLQREARATSTLRHPGIVPTYEYGEDAFFIFFAMEYIDGRNLGDSFNNGRRFDQPDAANIITQVLAALEHAHNNAIWHFDLKPTNVLIANDGRILVGDFSIDTRIERSAGSNMGTPGYISPERYLGNPVDHRADIFAAGAIFYQLLAGYAPFEGTPDAIMHSVCHRNLNVPSNGDPARRWPQYDAVVDRALMKRPEERYPSTGAFRAAVLAAYAYPLDDTIPASALEAGPMKGLPTEAARRESPSVTGVPSIGAPSLGGPVSAMPEGWDASVLEKVERELAKFLGPIARVLVKRGARAHTDLKALATVLSESVDAPADRKAFLAAIQKLSVGTPGGPPSLGPISANAIPSTTGSILPADEVERAIRLLAEHIGPVARVVVRRAAAGGLRRAELYEQIALEIDSASARDKFLRAAGL